MSITRKLFFLSVVAFVGLGLFAALVFATLRAVTVNGPAYHRIARSKDLVAEALPPPLFIVESYAVALQMVHAEAAAHRSADLTTLASLRADHALRAARWRRALSADDPRAAPLRDVDLSAARFFDTLDREFLPALARGDEPGASRALRGPLRDRYVAHRDAVERLVRVGHLVSDAEERQVRALLSWRAVQLGVIVALTAALVLLVGWAVSRSIVRPLEHTIGLLEHIADGDLSVRPECSGDDEVGRMSRALDRTVRALQESFARQQDALVRAEAGQRARATFLATMSHEVRTPLNGVLGMAQLLLRTPLDEAQADYVRTLQSSGESLLRVLDDMLDASRLDAGRLELRDAPFDLRELVDDLVQLFAARAAERGLGLYQRFSAAQPVTLRGDAVRLRQVLLNLVGNALKFTERGHVVIEARARVEGDRAEVTLAVRDTGVGIPDDKLDSLFQAFHQVDDSSTRRFGGTGVGLAISRQLVELMGGAIEVESAVGAGSTFRVRLSLPAVADVAPEPVPLERVPALVVSDQALQREILAETLAAWGASAVVSCTHAEALAGAGARFPGAGPCLLVIDRDRDDARFAAALQRARATVAHREVRVVVLREVASEGDEAHRGDVELARPVRMLALRRAAYELCLGRGVAALRARTRTTELPPEGRAPLRVLLVEDDRVNQRVALSLLSRLGCEVEVAANGREAIEMGLSARYDLVFMDCQMPVCDGFEATRTLVARWPDAQRAPIVALTANALEGDRERCMESGMTDFIAKPLRADELRRVFRAWAPRAPRPRPVDVAG